MPTGRLPQEVHQKREAKGRKQPSQGKDAFPDASPEDCQQKNTKIGMNPKTTFQNVWTKRKVKDVLY